MIKTIFFLLFVFSFLVVSAQKELISIDTTLKRIDTKFTKVDLSLNKIEGSVSKLKDELVKKNQEPYSGQSIFEDRNGNSAIFLPYGGTFRLNTGDASLKLSFVNRITTRKLFYGFDISGKTRDGISSFISKGDISPGVKIGGILGTQELFHNSNTLDGWLTLKVGYEGSSFKLFNSDSSFSKQINRTSFNTLTSSFSFNFKIGGNKILATSIGYQKVNNYDELDDLELTDQKIIKDANSNMTRTYESKTKVKVGDYKTADQVPINFDFYWYSSNMQRIGFYHYWRTKFTNGKATNGFGNGLYLLKKDKPLSSIAGIVFEINDVSKMSDGFGKNFTINFVVGYSFDFAKSK